MSEAFPDPAADTANKRRILVVDGSRVVRVTLAKRMEERFAVLEEDNGESAWQRLMLDGSIAVVVSSLNPPRLAALALLERMRASALRRLRETPMVLLVSDDNPEANTDEWRQQGIAAFMTKAMSKEEIAECLEGTLVAPVPSGSAESREEARGETGEAREKTPSGRFPTALMDAEDFVAAVAALPHEMTSDESLCVLVFGIDRLDELIERFGADVPELLTGRIAKLLAAKIDPRDVLGRCGENCVAIVSHGVDQRSGVHFGRRVCKSMASGQIAFHGLKVRLTTSVGVAATSDDFVESPEELLVLAQARLKQAMICGGNAVSTELHPDCPQCKKNKAMLRLFAQLGEALGAGQKEALDAAMRSLLQKTDADTARDVRLAIGLPEGGGDPLA